MRNLYYHNKIVYQSSIFNDSTILILFIFLKLITIEIKENIYVNIVVKIYVFIEIFSTKTTFVLRILYNILLCRTIPKNIPNIEAIIVRIIVSLYIYLKISFFLNPNTFIVEISFLRSFIFIGRKYCYK